MTTIDKSFIPMVDSLLVSRADRCIREFDDPLFACQYGLNAAFFNLATSHWVHAANDHLGSACRLHCLKLAHDFLAAYQLVRFSMHSQGANAIRLGCETAWQSALFHEDPTLAAQWAAGTRFQPAEARKRLPRLGQQRHVLYAELSQMAHPNMAATIGLQPPVPGSQTIDYQALLPVYDAVEVQRSIQRLFMALLIAQLDFEQYHLHRLNAEQRAVVEVQAKRMLQYYNAVVRAQLPEELRLPET